MTFYFETYGCQMNLAESAALKQTLLSRRWQEANSPEADLVIINTCSVRQTAEQRVFGRLGFYTAVKKKRAAEKKRCIVLVVGCMASRLGGALIERGADYVIGANEKSFVPILLDEIENGKKNQDAPDAPPVFEFESRYYEEGSFRSYIPIMHGCNNFCSYCIVPYVRGREVSRDPQSIKQEIQELAAKGVKEITLLGQNVNSYYWEDGAAKIDFSDLLKLVADWTRQTHNGDKGGIQWVRLLSSHPKDLSSRAIKVMADNSVFCRHLHLCAQHGSNVILAAMKRRYTKERYLELVGEIRAAMPDITLSTDILVGFPGETEKDFEAVLELMNETRYLYSFMYHYNPREGTEAFALPNRIDEAVKRERLSRVINLQMQHTQEILATRIGARETVLVESLSRNSPDELACRTERDEMIVAAGDARQIGSFAMIEIESLKGNTLRGRFVEKGA